MESKLEKIAQYYSGSGWLVLERSQNHIRVRREISNMPTNNWKIFTPVSHCGKYDKYDSRLVVIVTKGNNIIMCKHTFATLGNPEKVVVASDPVRGLIGMRKAKQDEIGYTVLNLKPGPNNKNPKRKLGKPYLNCKAFVDATKIQVNCIYNAYLDGEWLVVNLDQHPTNL